MDMNIQNVYILGQTNVGFHRRKVLSSDKTKSVEFIVLSFGILVSAMLMASGNGDKGVLVCLWTNLVVMAIRVCK